MRCIGEILRLRAQLKLSERDIARSVGVSRSSVQEYLRRAREAGVSWPSSSQMDEQALLGALYKPAGRPALQAERWPDFAWVQRELARKGVTRLLLWQEYKANHPEGLGYTVFCVRYREWLAKQSPVMRQRYELGEKLFVDYAGQTVAITDRLTGQVSQAAIFVAVLGASNYTYVEASLDQSLPSWLGSHVRMLRFYGGAPRIIVPDNLRAAVSKAHRYEPDLNPAYLEFANHYGVAVIPARVRKPRDKAKVEGGVLIVSRWILARLRERQFFSLGELNEAIALLLAQLNERPFKKLPGSRQSVFEQQERAALQALPERAYEFARWKQVKVHPDYHVQVERCFYSVPHQFIGQTLQARVSESMVELFHGNRLVATHLASACPPGQFYTHAQHRPASHTAQLQVSLGKVHARAAHIGPATLEVVQLQARHRLHPEQTLRSARAIVRLAHDFSGEHLEAACAKALTLSAFSYRVVRDLLQTQTAYPAHDSAESHPGGANPSRFEHANLRGAQYFQ